MSNPYADLPPTSFWSNAVSYKNPGDVDPCVGMHKIAPHEKISTMGSCFAQHMARFVQGSGLTYYVPEAAPDGLSEAERMARGFGVFSARYGNVYAVRQALQLFQRAFGKFTPADDVWASSDRYVDAFRPRIEPGGFASPEAVRAEAARHLGYVRDVFTRSDWLIFTLGLTESWRSRIDGAVYPLAPGVAGGAFDPERYTFVNASFGETMGDLCEFIEGVKSVNSGIKILLTVSPVALIATYEPRHVLTSTVASKAILRAVADEAERRYDYVTYFPSYEIITSPSAEGRYYADDLRNIDQRGIDHVMRVFRKHFIDPEMAAAAPDVTLALKLVQSDRDVVCDEQEIALALKPRR